MKLRSYYALILLLSFTTPLTTLHAVDQQDHRARSVREVTSIEDLNNIIADPDNALVVVDFYASWCGPCQRMAPDFAKLPGTFTDIVFVKVSVDIPGITSSFGIKSMPTLICYKNGQKIKQTPGAKSFTELKNYVNSVFNS